MSTIGLCIMMKDEERYIQQCIESLKDYVDEIYILDTGSKDCSIEIAKRYTNNIFELKFNNDFSSMRNHLLNLAETEWILYLDADEYLCEYDAKLLKKTVEDVNKNVGGIKFVRYNFFATGGWYSGKVLKLFRNNKDIKYEGRISESVESSIVENGFDIIDSNVLINHIGHCRTRFERDAKANRYMQAFNARLEEEPLNALMHAFIALNARVIGDFKLAVVEIENALELSPNSPTMHFFAGHIYRAVNRANDAIMEYKIANELRANDGQILNMLGVMYLSLGEFKEARKYLNQAIEINNNLIHVFVNLGLLEYSCKNYKYALEQFEYVVNRNPGFLHFDFIGSNECDPYRAFYYETIFSYSDLGTYLEACKSKINQWV